MLTSMLIIFTSTLKNCRLLTDKYEFFITIHKEVKKTEYIFKIVDTL